MYANLTYSNIHNNNNVRGEGSKISFGGIPNSRNVLFLQIFLKSPSFTAMVFCLRRFLRCFGPFGGKEFHLGDVKKYLGFFYVVLGSGRGPGVENIAS